MISQETIQQIQSRIDIIDIVGGFVKLKKEVPIIWVIVHFIMKKHLHSPSHLPKKFTNVLDVAKVVIPLVF